MKIALYNIYAFCIKYLLVLYFNKFSTKRRVVMKMTTRYQSKGNINDCKNANEKLLAVARLWFFNTDIDLIVTKKMLAYKQVTTLLTMLPPKYFRFEVFHEEFIEFKKYTDHFLTTLNDEKSGQTNNHNNNLKTFKEQLTELTEKNKNVKSEANNQVKIMEILCGNKEVHTNIYHHRKRK